MKASVLSNIFFLFIVMAQSVLAANAYSDHEASKVWKGSIYGDTIIEDFRRKNPDMELVMDLNDLLAFNKEGATDKPAPELDKDLRAGAKKIRTEKDKIESQPSAIDKLMSIGFTVLPEGISEILDQLKNGQVIYLARNAQQWNRVELEDSLKAWILSQENNSVSPHEVMVKSLELTKGKVLVAWVIAWNVLRDRWGAAAVRNYSAVTQKIISLSGERNVWKGGVHYVPLDPSQKQYGETKIITANGSELENKERRFYEMQVTKRGDEFSYFYHRVGVEIFSMVMAEYSKNKFIGNMAGAAGAIAEWLKYTKTAGVEKERKKRVINDILASRSGARVYQLVKSKKPTDLAKASSLDASLYFGSLNVLYDKEYKLEKNKAAIFKGTELSQKYWDNNYSVEELKFIFRHATQYDANILSPIVLASNDSGTTLHQGLVKYLNSHANDPELNSYIKDYLDGVRAYPKVEDVKVDLDMDRDLNEEIMKELDPNFDLKKSEEYLSKVLQRVWITKTQESKNKEALTLKMLNQKSSGVSQCLRFYIKH